MSILHRTLDTDVHLLKLSRPLSGRWANELEQKFNDALSRGAKRVIVDLEDVPLVDSRGLAALVKGYKTFGSNGQNFQLAALQEQPRLLLELTMFDRIFQVFDTVAEAIESIPYHSIQFVQEARAFVPQLVVR
jgi:anti-sigma B factor antagonist